VAIHKTAAFSVRPEGAARAEAAIREFIDYIRANELGTRVYVSLRDEKDPARYLHVMEFADAAAEETHRASDAARRFTSALYPETVDGVVFTDYDRVA
jgi:quinol monooxygenase YgiN